MKVIRTYLIYTLLLGLLLSCNEKKKDVRIEYYQNGIIQSVKNYKDNLLEGQSTWFYPNGNLETAIHFIKGKANGNAFYFYKSGSIKSQGFWRNDTVIGFVTNYYDDSIGVVKNVASYDSLGKRISITKGDTTNLLPLLH